MSERRAQLRFPAARRWPTQWAPDYGEMESFYKYVVWKGVAANLRQAARLVIEITTAYDEGLLRPTNAATETRLLDSLDEVLDAAPELAALFLARN